MDKTKTLCLQFFKIIKVSAVYRAIKNNEFYYVYLLKFDGNIKRLKLQKEEVQEIKFFPLSKIEEGLKEYPHKYVSHGDYWFEVIAEVKRKLKTK